MGRKKLELAWITNDSARRKTLKTRTEGLMKKVSELSVLCGVRACAVVRAPQEPQPQAWPSLPEAARLLAELRSMPEAHKSRNMVDNEAFLLRGNAQAHEQLRRRQHENRETAARIVMLEALAGRGLHGTCMEDVQCVAWLVEARVNAVRERIKAAKKETAPAPAVAAEEENAQQMMGFGMQEPVVDHRHIAMPFFMPSSSSLKHVLK